jgi:hypothetical protein
VVELLDQVKDSANALLRRRALSSYAARELLDAADAIDAWLEGEGDDGEENARVERFAGAFEALRVVEGR